MKFRLLVAILLLSPALSAIAAPPSELTQIPDEAANGARALPEIISMGPDPGGHTGATVTPETTKTGNSAVDSAREARSGSNTEILSAPVDESRPVKKESKTAPADESRPAK
jgi:hypothetical protein